MSRRVLIIRLSAMGDVAMVATTVAQLCREYPDVHFDMLSTAFFEPMFEKADNFTFVGTNIKKERGLKSIWRLFRSLCRRVDYDVVVDLHDVIRTKILRLFFAIVGTKTVKLDKGRTEKNRLIAAHGKHLQQLKHTTERYADALAKAGFALSNSGTTMPKRPVPQAIGRERKKGETWIGVAPFAQHEGKVYPLEKTEQVVARLAAADNVQVFLFGGGAAEKGIASGWAERYGGNCHNVIGIMSLADELSLISNLDCMLSMDSSAMHMASLFGVRVVSVWGATHPYAGFLGFGQKPDDVIQMDLPCRPCSIYGNKPCRRADYRCFDIDPETVVAKISESMCQNAK